MERDETMESSDISPTRIMQSRTSLAKLSESGRKVCGLPHRSLTLVGKRKTNTTDKADPKSPANGLACLAMASTATIQRLAFASAALTTRPLTKRGRGCGRGIPSTEKVRAVGMAYPNILHARRQATRRVELS